MSITRVVAITGCDSGLGWALAARAAKEGMLTVAGMYNGVDTKAALALKKVGTHPFSLDVTIPDSVAAFRNYVNEIIKENNNYKLYAVVNNAGQMIIGDYEWQTPTMIENTINVNLLGAMRVVSAFLPDLRETALEGTIKPRIINVASHCGLYPLPGFAAYSASKAALLAWTRALRHEHRAHGLSAVSFVPGGFIGSSNLLSNQTIHGDAMLHHLNEEQKSFYGKRIDALINYLSGVSLNQEFDMLKDQNIIETFVQALNDDEPKELYKVESLRYALYYNLMRLPLPESVHHFIIKRFLSFPEVK